MKTKEAIYIVNELEDIRMYFYDRMDIDDNGNANESMRFYSIVEKIQRIISPYTIEKQKP